MTMTTATATTRRIKGRKKLLFRWWLLLGCLSFFRVRFPPPLVSFPTSETLRGGIADTLAKDLDEDVVFVDGSANNANNEREEEEEEEEEPETYERPSSPMPPMDPSAPPPPPVAPSMPPPDDAMRRERVDAATTTSKTAATDATINRNLAFFSGTLDEPSIKDHRSYKSNENDASDLWAKRRRELFGGSLHHPYVDEDDEDTTHSEQTKRYASLDKILDLKELKEVSPVYDGTSRVRDRDAVTRDVCNRRVGDVGGELVGV